MNAAPSLLVNQVRSPNHWIGIRTVGTKSNRDGIGARVTVKVGARMLVDEVRSGSSYDSNNDMRIHFGLGAATKIEWIQIRWPSGLTERFENNHRGCDSHAERRIGSRGQAARQEFLRSRCARVSFASFASPWRTLRSKALTAKIAKELAKDAKNVRTQKLERAVSATG